jgi:hypothetical protein
MGLEKVMGMFGNKDNIQDFESTKDSLRHFLLNQMAGESGFQHSEIIDDNIIDGANWEKLEDELEVLAKQHPLKYRQIKSSLKKLEDLAIKTKQLEDYIRWQQGQSDLKEPEKYVANSYLESLKDKQVKTAKKEYEKILSKMKAAEDLRYSVIKVAVDQMVEDLDGASSATDAEKVSLRLQTLRNSLDGNVLAKDKFLSEQLDRVISDDVIKIIVRSCDLPPEQRNQFILNGLRTNVMQNKHFTDAKDACAFLYDVLNKIRSSWAQIRPPVGYFVDIWPGPAKNSAFLDDLVNQARVGAGKKGLDRPKHFDLSNDYIYSVVNAETGLMKKEKMAADRAAAAEEEKRKKEAEEKEAEEKARLEAEELEKNKKEEEGAAAIAAANQAAGGSSGSNQNQGPSDAEKKTTEQKEMEKNELHELLAAVGNENKMVALCQNFITWEEKGLLDSSEWKGMLDDVEDKDLQVLGRHLFNLSEKLQSDSEKEKDREAVRFVLGKIVDHIPNLFDFGKPKTKKDIKGDASKQDGLKNFGGASHLIPLEEFADGEKNLNEKKEATADEFKEEWKAFIQLLKEWGEVKLEEEKLDLAEEIASSCIEIFKNGGKEKIKKFRLESGFNLPKIRVKALNVVAQELQEAYFDNLENSEEYKAVTDMLALLMMPKGVLKTNEAIRQKKKGFEAATSKELFEKEKSLFDSFGKLVEELKAVKGMTHKNLTADLFKKIFSECTSLSEAVLELKKEGVDRPFVDASYYHSRVLINVLEDLKKFDIRSFRSAVPIDFNKTKDVFQSLKITIEDELRERDNVLDLGVETPLSEVNSVNTNEVSIDKREIEINQEQVRRLGLLAVDIAGADEASLRGLVSFRVPAISSQLFGEGLEKKVPEKTIASLAEKLSRESWDDEAKEALIRISKRLAQKRELSTDLVILLLVKTGELLRQAVEKQGDSVVVEELPPLPPVPPRPTGITTGDFNKNFKFVRDTRLAAESELPSVEKLRREFLKNPNIVLALAKANEGGAILTLDVCREFGIVAVDAEKIKEWLLENKIVFKEKESDALHYFKPNELSPEVKENLKQALNGILSELKKKGRNNVGEAENRLILNAIGVLQKLGLRFEYSENIAVVKQDAVAESIKPEEEKAKTIESKTFSTQFIETKIRSLLVSSDNIKEIKKLEVTSGGGEMTLDLEVAAGPLSSRVGVRAVLESKAGSIVVKDHKINASWAIKGTVEKLLVPKLDEVSGFLQSYIEKQENKKVEKMEIVDGQLVVRFKE